MDGHRELRPEERQQSGRTLTARCWKSSTLVMQIARLRSPADCGRETCAGLDAGTYHSRGPPMFVSVLHTAKTDICIFQLGRMIFGLASPRESGRLRDGVGIASFCLTNTRQAASRPFPSARRPRRLFRRRRQRRRRVQSDNSANAGTDFHADGDADTGTHAHADVIADTIRCSNAFRMIWMFEE